MDPVRQQKAPQTAAQWRAAARSRVAARSSTAACSLAARKWASVCALIAVAQEAGKGVGCVSQGCSFDGVCLALLWCRNAPSCPPETRGRASTRSGNDCGSHSARTSSGRRADCAVVSKREVQSYS